MICFNRVRIGPRNTSRRYFGHQITWYFTEKTALRVDRYCMDLTINHTYDNNSPLRGPKDGIGYPPTEVEGLRRRKFRSIIPLWWWTGWRTARHDDPVNTTRPEPYSPYCGLVVNANDQYEKVQGAPHLAISAPTRTGKTRRLLAPAAVLHPGPLVAVSSKEDPSAPMAKACRTTRLSVRHRPSRASSVQAAGAV